MQILHHFFHFPLVFNTVAIRLGIISTSLLQSSRVKEENDSSMWDHNSSIPFGGVSYQFNFLFKMAHKCSIGFKCGDWGGQDKTLFCCLESHCFMLLLLCMGALSYWKMTSDASKKYLLIVPCRCSSNIFLITMLIEATFNSVYHADPCIHMHPHIITKSPPCLIVKIISRCDSSCGLEIKYQTLSSEENLLTLV